MIGKRTIIGYFKAMALTLYMGVSFAILIPPLQLWDMEFFTRYDFYLRAAVVASVFIIRAVQLWREKKVDGYTGWLCIFFGVMVFSTLLHNGNLKQALWGETIIPLTVLFLVQNCIFISERRMIRVLYVLYYLFSLVNLYTVIKYDGTEAYFFANRNLHLYFYLIPLFCGYYGLAKGYLKSRLIYLAFYALSLVSVAFAGGLTTTIALAVWGIFLLLHSWEGLGVFLNGKMNFLMQTGLFAVLQVYTFFPTNVLGKLIESTGKSATFSGRTPIWRDAWELIMQAPVFGQGMIDLNAYLGYRHAHNIFLQTLCRRGFVGIAVLLILLLLLYKAAGIWKDAKMKNLMLAMLFCLLLAGQFDVGYIQYYSLYGALIYCLAEAGKDGIRI